MKKQTTVFIFVVILLIPRSILSQNYKPGNAKETVRLQDTIETLNANQSPGYLHSDVAPTHGHKKSMVQRDNKNQEILPNLKSIFQKPSSTWDVHFNYDVESSTGDFQCYGVEFDGSFFWITGGGAGGDNKLYKFDRDGNLLTSYLQGTKSSWGYRDLAWDGTYLYGSDEDVMAVINPANGAKIDSFASPILPARALAYDPATDHFWTADWGSDIYEFDRNGNSWPYPNTNGLAITGMAWDDVSLDGPWLWIWSQDGSALQQCSQYDPINHVFTGVTYQGTGTQYAGGACFAYEWLPGFGLFVGLDQGTLVDNITGYEIVDFRENMQVLTPNGGEVWYAGSTYDITWLSDWSGTVMLEFSTNGGSTWTTITSSTLDGGNYPWLVSDTPSTTCRIRVTDTDGSPSDMSDENFTIARKVVTVTFPNGGDVLNVASTHNITWNSDGVTDLNLEFSSDGGLTWRAIISGMADNGSYVWPVPNIPSTTCRVRVSDTDGSPSDMSDDNFTIQAILPDTLRINYTSDWPTIDGVIDDPVWANVAPVSLEKYLETAPPPDDDTDLSGYYKAAWNDSSLYFMADITDDIIINDNSTSWYNDGIEIYFDADNSKRADAYDSNDEHFYFVYNGVSGAAVGNINLDNAVMAWRERTGGYILELALRYQDMHFDLNPDGVFGWDVQVNDGDETTRSHGLRWFTGNDHSWINPSIFGEAQLIYTSPPALTVNSPNGGEVFHVGSNQTITWSSTLANQQLRVEFSIDNGATWRPFAQANSDDESINWPCPNLPSTTSLVRLSTLDGLLSDQSDQTFTIQGIQPEILSVAKTTIPPVIDGVTDDAAWAGTADISLAKYLDVVLPPDNAADLSGSYKALWYDNL